jgi:hypothetical protein
MFISQIHTHVKYPVHIGDSSGSITEYLHQRIKRIRPQILHQKFTYLYQNHAFDNKVYSTKYIKEYKAACLN